MLNCWLWLLWLAYWNTAAIFVKRTKTSESIWTRLQYMIPLSLGCCLMFHDRKFSIVSGRLYYSDAVAYLGVAITLAGLLFSIWARVHLGSYWSGYVTLKEGHKLIRTGPFKIVRHPIYTGLQFAVLATGLSAATGDGFLAFPIILASFITKIRREEALLIHEFGEEYRQFKREVPALVPFLF